MKKYITWKTALLAVVGAVLLYTLLGFIAVPFAGKKIISKGIQRLPGCTGEVAKVRFNPYTLEIRLEGLKINETSGEPVFRLKRLYVNLSAASVVKLAPVVDQLDLNGPEVFLALNKDNRLNIIALLADSGTAEEKDAAEPKPSAETEKKIFPFRLANAAIHDGHFHFSDKIRGKDQVVDRINLSLPLLTSLEGERDTHAEPVLQLAINGAPVEIRLASLPFTRDLNTRIELTAKEIDLAAAVPYLSLPKALKIASPGRLDLSLTGTYRLDPARKKQPHILGLDLKLALKALDILTREDGTGTTLPLISCPEFIVEAASKDLLAGTANVNKFDLNNVKLNLKRNVDGQLSLMDVFTNNSEKHADTAPEEKKAATDSVKFHVSVAQGGLNKGEISFTDDSVTPVFKTVVSGVNLGVKDMQITPKGISGSYGAGFSTESNETLSLHGALATTPAIAVDGRLELNDILPEKYRPYYAPYGGKGLTLGNIGMGAGFRLAITDSDPVFSVTDGGLTLRDIRIQGDADKIPVVEIKSIDCSGIGVDSETRRIRVATVLADSGALALIRDKKGEINLLQSINAMVTTKDRDASMEKKTPPSGDESKSENENNPDGQKDAAGPWEISLGKFDLKNYGLAFSDLTPADPVRLKAGNIGIIAEELTTTPGKEGKIRAGLTLQKSGKINIGGTFAPSPPAANLDINLKKIDVRSFQPYFTDYLNILVAKGHVGTKGRLTVSLPKSGGPDIRYTGEAALNDLVSKTKIDNTDFFRCKSLFLSGMDIDLSPMAVNIKEISLTDFYQKTIISKSGILNLSTIAKPSGKAKESNGEKEKKGSKKSAAGPVINISAVTLQGGHINFTDQHTPPGFTSNMTDVGGSLTGLSSLPNKEPAQLLLKGTHGNHSPLDISGLIDPFKKDLFVDLAISFKNIELPQFNTYTEKYLGYAIDKGKLILDFKYNIQGNQLNSSNHIFFDQLTLGKSVDSPDAVSLPLELAISLLKNSKDEIKLDVPITGDLNDPEFSYGSVVVTTLTNLILGVVTAPFKFLGSLVGLASDQDLGHVAFAPGSDVLKDAEKAKIEQLAAILVEKEKLNLEIDGKYNPEKDGDRLRKIKYQQLLSGIQTEMEIAPGVEIDQIPWEERVDVVQLAYERAEFPKPRDESGKEKELTPEEMEKLLITAIHVGENDLKDLALRRSDKIRDHMVHSGGIDPLRIFIKDPEAVAEDQVNEDDVNTQFELK